MREKEGRFIVKRTGDMNRKSVVRNVRTGDRCELTFFNESSYQTVLHWIGGTLKTREQLKNQGR